MELISYVGKKVSIGIDVHKNHYSICCLVESKKVQKVTMPANPIKLLEYINKRFKGAEVISAYEAGFSGFALHRSLEEGGISNLVVNAASIEVASRDRVKTDRRDAEKLASLLECGRLKSIRIPSLDQEKSRLLQRTREQLVRDKNRLSNRIKMRLYQFGLDVPSKMSSKALSDILCSPELSYDFKYPISKQISQWKSITNDIKEIEQIQHKTYSSHPLFKIYSSIPGFGLQTTSTIISELGDMSQFPNERALFSFVGLTPTERSSGDKEIKGHISRQGNPRIRKLLVEAAWGAMRTDPYWRSEYSNKSFKLGGKRAIVSIARRLIGVARALAKNNSIYQQKMLS